MSDEKYLLAVGIMGLFLLIPGLIFVAIGYFKDGYVWQYSIGFVGTITGGLIVFTALIFYLALKLQ